jgi:hypothetical protein
MLSFSRTISTIRCFNADKLHIFRQLQSLSEEDHLHLPVLVWWYGSEMVVSSQFFHASVHAEPKWNGDGINLHPRLADYTNKADIIYWLHPQSEFVNLLWNLLAVVLPALYISSMPLVSFSCPRTMHCF